MTAASTVVAIGIARATPLLTRGSEGMLETLSAIGSAHACLVGSCRLVAPPGAGRHRHRLGQGSGEPVIDDHDIAQLRQLDIGLDPRAPALERGNDAHRE